MTTEERLAKLETTARTHDAMFNLLITIGERQQTLLEEIQAEVKELHRDNRQSQRLWVHLAKKNGWMEDGDWPPPEA